MKSQIYPLDFGKMTRQIIKQTKTMYYFNFFERDVRDLNNAFITLK